MKTEEASGRSRRHRMRERGERKPERGRSEAEREIKNSFTSSGE